MTDTKATAAAPAPVKKESALAPFKHTTFTVMWTAALISNIGTWMHSVGAGWLMTSLSPSPLIIALVQTATTLPVFVLPCRLGRWRILLTAGPCCCGRTY